MIIMCYPVSTHFIYCSTYICSKLCSVYSVMGWTMEEILFNLWRGQLIFLFSKASRSTMGATWFSFPWAEVIGVWSLPLNSISLSRLGMGWCMPPIPPDAILACRGTGLNLSTMSLVELFPYNEVISRLHIYFYVQIVCIILRLNTCMETVLNPCGSVLEKFIVPPLVKMFSASYGSWRFIFVVPILSHMNPIHTLPPWLF